MIQQKLGFIGAGNMACAIVEGLLRQRRISPEQICVADPAPAALQRMDGLDVQTTSNNQAAARFADILILAVKPQVYDAVLPDLSEVVSGKCVVSIAPGISTSYLGRQLKGAYVVRAMPNTPLLIGKGATAIAQSQQVPQPLFQSVLEIFSAGGETAVIPEEQMNDIVSVSGSSPAFFFRMAGAMVAQAQRQGLDPALALRMVARTMEGAAGMLLEAGKTPQELVAQVCSPGGTTLAALSAFDEMGFDELISEAMIRCIKRAGELGKS